MADMDIHSIAAKKFNHYSSKPIFKEKGNIINRDFELQI